MFESSQIHGFKLSHHVNNGFMEYGGLSESNVSSFSIDFQFLHLGKKKRKKRLFGRTINNHFHHHKGDNIKRKRE